VGTIAYVAQYDGDLLIIDYSADVGKLVFSKEAGGALINDDRGDASPDENVEAESNGNAAAVAQPAPAKAKNE
ncbi:MAG: hypothetical protein ABI882_20565, partial [Acidobacteriota bacterium]